MFGGTCQNNADQSATQQSAINAAEALGMPWHVGGMGINGNNLCVFAASVTATNKFGMVTDGKTNTQIVTTGNFPFLIWNVTKPVADFDIGGFTVINQQLSGSAYAQASAITLTGNGSLVTYGKIHDINTYGIWAAILNDLPSHATANGQEGGINWTDFSDIDLQPGDNPAEHLFYSAYGSGTGNTFRGNKGALAADGSVLDYETTSGVTNNVVGDIVFEGGHFGGLPPGTNGLPGSSLIRVAAGTIYRTNIAVVATQADAGMLRIFDLASDFLNAPFTRITYKGDNVGGGVTVVTVPLVQSVIDDQQASDWRMGSAKTSAVTGQQTVPLFSVTTATGFDGSSCHVSVSGVVAGQQGGVVEGEYALGSNVSATAPVGSALASSGTTSAFYSLVWSVAGNVSTVSTSFDSGGPGSTMDAQIRCQGGTMLISRL